jgi:hypothetical protein
MFPFVPFVSSCDWWRGTLNLLPVIGLYQQSCSPPCSTNLQPALLNFLVASDVLFSNVLLINYIAKITIFLLFFQLFLLKEKDLTFKSSF